MSLVREVPLEFNFDLLASGHFEGVDAVVAVVPHEYVLGILFLDVHRVLNILRVDFALVSDASVVPGVGSKVHSLVLGRLECHLVFGAAIPTEVRPSALVVIVVGRVVLWL